VRPVSAGTQTDYSPVVTDLRETAVKRPTPPSVPRGAPVVYFIEDPNDDDIPSCWSDPIVLWYHTPGSPATQPPAGPSHSKPSLTTLPFVNSAFTIKDQGLPPCQSLRPSSPRLTTSGPRVAHRSSTDLGNCARLPPPSSPTSHHHHTSTPLAPSAPTIDSSAPPTLLHPSGLAHPFPVSSTSTTPTLGCDRDKAQSGDVGPSLAPNDVVRYDISPQTHPGTDFGASGDLSTPSARRDQTAKNSHPSLGTVKLSLDSAKSVTGMSRLDQARRQATVAKGISLHNAIQYALAAYHRQK